MIRRTKRTQPRQSDALGGGETIVTGTLNTAAGSVVVSEPPSTTDCISVIPFKKYKRAAVAKRGDASGGGADDAKEDHDLHKDDDVVFSTVESAAAQVGIARAEAGDRIDEIDMAVTLARQHAQAKISESAEAEAATAAVHARFARNGKTPIPSASVLAAPVIGASFLTEFLPERCSCGRPIASHGFAIALAVSSAVAAASKSQNHDKATKQAVISYLNKYKMRMCCRSRFLSPLVTTVVSADIGATYIDPGAVELGVINSISEDAPPAITAENFFGNERICVPISMFEP